jgi:hypothetical protein
MAYASKYPFGRVSYDPLTGKPVYQGTPGSTQPLTKHFSFGPGNQNPGPAAGSAPSKAWPNYSSFSSRSLRDPGAQEACGGSAKGSFRDPGKSMGPAKVYQGFSSKSVEKPYAHGTMKYETAFSRPKFTIKMNGAPDEFEMTGKEIESFQIAVYLDARNDTELAGYMRTAPGLAPSQELLESMGLVKPKKP